MSLNTMKCISKVTNVLSTNLHMFDPRSLHKVCKNCVCEKEATIYSHNGSVGFRNLKQQWNS